MTVAFYLLLIIGHLGIFDVLYFHTYRCDLQRRIECQREVLWHTIRHAIYGAQFIVIANLRFHGWALILLALIYIADVVVAWGDVWEETNSRKSQGGLPAGEYFMHILLSLLVGAYIILVSQSVWVDWFLPTGIVIDPPHVPWILRTYMTIMGITAWCVFFHDLYRWINFGKSIMRKIVVEVFIPASVDVVWERTQEPSQHLAWDIRFTHISYLDLYDERGFQLMDYRTKLGFGIEVKGTGRYLHTNPPRHSTFEFFSEDWKSLITYGRGIWQYEEREGGTYFRTVFDYDVRYGAIGRLIDKLIFRPVMQLATEWGFETLKLWSAGDNQALKYRSNIIRFIGFYIARRFGFTPSIGVARSWIGSGKESYLKELSVVRTV
jgi:hypothetical protein